MARKETTFRARGGGGAMMANIPFLAVLLLALLAGQRAEGAPAADGDGKRYSVAYLFWDFWYSAKLLPLFAYLTAHHPSNPTVLARKLRRPIFCLSPFCNRFATPIPLPAHTSAHTARAPLIGMEERETVRF